MTAVAVAVLVGGAFGGVAHAKKQKLVAKVGRKLLKIPSKNILATHNFAGIIVAGVKLTYAGRATTTRNFWLGCEVGGLAAGMSVPVTVGCAGTYLVGGLSGGQGWATDSNEITLTIKSFDGTRLVGTFSGQMGPDDNHPGDPPISIQNGKLSVDLKDG